MNKYINASIVFMALLTLFLAGCATVPYTMAPSPDRDLLNSLHRDGIGERFLMSRFTAVNGGTVGKYKLIGRDDGGMIILSPEGGRSQKPIGHGSIILIENRLNLALKVDNGYESIVSFAATDDYSNNPNVG